GTSFRAAVHESRVDKYAGVNRPRSFRWLRTCRGDSLPTISGCLVLRVQQTRGCGSPSASCFHSCRVGTPTSAHHLPIRASSYSLGVAGAPPLAFSMAADGPVRRLGCADQRCTAG